LSFYKVIENYKDFDFAAFFNAVTDQDIERILAKDKLSETDFLMLLSEKTVSFLEPMAAKAQQLTVQSFGKTIQLFIPLYIGTTVPMSVPIVALISKTQLSGEN